MNRASLRMRHVARHLVDTSALETSGTLAGSATFSVIDTLRPHLRMLMGTGGTRQLLARALVLAEVEVSWLRAVRVNGRGDWENLGQIASLIDPTEFLEGKVVLLAQLLGLLVALIGPNLTSRTVGELWPHIPFQDRNFGAEHKDDEAS